MIHSGQKEATHCPSTDDGVNKMVQPHSGMSFSLKKDVVTPAPTKWMNLEDITLIETSEVQTTNIFMIPSYEVLKVVGSTEATQNGLPGEVGCGELFDVQGSSFATCTTM